MKKILAFLLFFIGFSQLFAQDLLRYEKKLFIAKKDTLPYRLLLPKNYDSNKSYPLILMLHGAGERGSDNEKQLVHGSKLFLEEKNRDQFPAFVLFPQCPENDYWSNVSEKETVDGKWTFGFLNGGTPTKAMVLVQAMLKDFIKTHRVNENQIYVGGLSMGGMGTFEIVNRNPELFAAAFPICGGANPEIAANLKSTDWWVFHGGADSVVPVEFSQQMVAALNREGANVKFSYYPEVDHNSWDNAFADPQLLPWLFSHK